MKNNNPNKAELLYQIIYDATKEKFATLPFLAGLFLALISFGISGDLFPLTYTIRAIVTILLFLMILSIQISYSQNIALLIEAQKKFDEHLGKENINTSLSVAQSFKYLFSGKINGKIKEKDFFKRFSSQFPALAILILWVVVFILVFQVWCS